MSHCESCRDRRVCTAWHTAGVEGKKSKGDQRFSTVKNSLGKMQFRSFLSPIFPHRPFSFSHATTQTPNGLLHKSTAVAFMHFAGQSSPMIQKRDTGPGAGDDQTPGLFQGFFSVAVTPFMSASPLFVPPAFVPVPSRPPTERPVSLRSLSHEPFSFVKSLQKNPRKLS